jgi:hypothetical protein
MSAVNEEPPIDPQDPLYYAPKWLRDHPDRQSRRRQPSLAETARHAAASSSSLPQRPRFENELEDAVARALRQPTDMVEPMPPIELPEEDYSDNPTNSMMRIGKLLAAILVAGGVALTYVMLMPGSRPPVTAENGPANFAQSMQAIQAASIAAPQPATPVAPVVAKDDSAAVIAAPTPEPRRIAPEVKANAVSDAGPAIRQMPADEVAGLVRRGEELARSGDLAAARLLLQRAAEAHNARAAFVLAATYDPIIIAKIAVNSPLADVKLARAWYQRALEWGSAEAPKQLEALASMR